MKKLIIALIFNLFVAGYAYAESITTTKIEERNGISYLLNEKEPFTGKNETYYPNGKKKFEENYKDGKVNGFKWYGDDGKLITESIYKDGEKYSSVQYYSNGKKFMETNYKDGKQNGLSTMWSENGNKVEEINYKDGKQHGLSTVWFGNNNKVGFIYENGKK